MRTVDEIRVAGRSATGFIEQRLTPAGVDLVVAEMLSTGLFARCISTFSAPMV